MSEQQKGFEGKPESPSPEEEKKELSLSPNEVHTMSYLIDRELLDLKKEKRPDDDDYTNKLKQLFLKLQGREFDS
ncbi:hypothetical protein A3D55_02710 [Candidatus Jorgensenbacteria bacterium RIFCSPHIGHO2_02_FULL_45_20]|uniref:Uncharacterized protein n=2 Tax=Candidatus Joergenseniibacteriota TaxID=1752739 RepID=A0A1F6BRW9_9BACT|nr:MAG: hypothetical protein UX22_C0007G0034 [Candidatus Jorgensenbacteria bacterium GW2011_GWA2_45_9]OGG39287.1 MAG: hypothetical protein A3D55_02710 [Candidatus Jorgensenbacteria bacterium RIFCSPHIGHO2_02_FULL_45_20]